VSGDALARWALPVAMFLGSFAWSFVHVSLPFYIQDLSRFDAATTLRWTGFIFGISPLITVITAPISGWLAGSRDPKRAFVWTQGLQAAGFVLMAFARTLGEIFFARCLLGAMGAVSTFAFIMAGRSGGDVRREVSEIQLGMTLGQVLGPAAGALTAARLGFRLSFLLSSVMLGLCAWLVAWAVPAGRGRAASSQARAGTASLREVATVCVLVLGCLTQVFFLTAILPQVLPRLGVPLQSMLEVGGLVLLTDGLAMALGTMAAPRVAEAFGDRRAVPWLLGCSSLFLGMLSLATSVWTFVAIRFVQVLCIAPIFPLAVAAIAHRASGEAIGFLNSARIGASFVGPVFATTLLAWFPPSSVELSLAAFGLLLVPVVASGRSGRPRDGIAP
jgi:MFS family permease